MVGELMRDGAVVISSDQIMVLDHMEGCSRCNLQCFQVNAFVHPIATKPLVIGQEFLPRDDDIRLEIFLVRHRIGLLIFSNVVSTQRSRPSERRE